MSADTQAPDLGPKPATPITCAHNRSVLGSLPFGDRADFEDARRGFIGTLPKVEFRNAEGRVIYSLEDYAFLTEEQAPDTVNPSLWRQAQLNAEDIDLVSTHATATASGDVQECVALRQVFTGDRQPVVNNTKSFIGHAMGAAGALELAGNLPTFDDDVCHPTINVDRLDPECALPGLALNEPRERKNTRYILNNSFGMLGINSVVIIGKV